MSGRQSGQNPVRGMMRTVVEPQMRRQQWVTGGRRPSTRKDEHGREAGLAPMKRRLAAETKREKCAKV
jgi:hypothetical protein